MFVKRREGCVSGEDKRVQEVLEEVGQSVLETRNAAFPNETNLT